MALAGARYFFVVQQLYALLPCFEIVDITDTVDEYGHVDIPRGSST